MSGSAPKVSDKSLDVSTQPDAPAPCRNTVNLVRERCGSKRATGPASDPKTEVAKTPRTTARNYAEIGAALLVVFGLFLALSRRGHGRARAANAPEA
jgi:hypothetical protein